MNIILLDRICRTCLSEKNPEELRSLYDNSIKEELQEIASIKIEENDGLPPGICNDCSYTLNISLGFRNQCQKSEAHLKGILFPETPTIYKTITILNSDSEFTQIKIYNDEDIPKANEDIEITNSIINIGSDECENHNKIQSSSPPADLEAENFVLSDQNVNVSSVIKYNPKNINYNDVEEFSNQTYECFECKKKFKFETTLKSHMVRHGKKLECEVCHQEFNGMKTYTGHRRTKHPELRPYKCKQCEKGYFTSTALIKHKRAHGGERKHLCNVCGKRFFELNRLLVHSRTHTGEKPLSCDKCGRKFSTKNGLLIHNKVHTGERKYQCNMCGRRFAHSFVLTVHKRVHTGEKPYKCKICNSSFSSASYLKIHQRIHFQEKPYQCDECPKAFVGKSGLVTHKRTHSGEKCFQCNICGKTMGRSHDLLVHTRTHTGEKPYECNQCDKRYMTSSNLATHRRTHLGKKDFICSTCGKAFGDPRTLKSHYRVHTGEKPYVCTVCGNRYSQSGQLSVHKRIHKSNERRQDQNILNFNTYS